MSTPDLDLFLLMFNLSQIDSAEEIKRIYTESMTDHFQGLVFHFEKEKDEDAPNGFPLVKKTHNYGYIYIDGGFHSLEPEIQAAIRNSIGLLVIILENRSLAASLSQKNLHLETTLKENEKLLANIAQAVPEIVYVYDLAEGINIYSNDGLGKILGYTKRDLDAMGHGFLDQVCHPDDLDSVKTHHEKMLSASESEIRMLEYRIKHKSGDWKWLLSRDMPYSKDEHGNTGRILGCATDITDIKNYESKLSKSLAEKETLLKEVHHRVKNNLAMIVSFLSLQSMYTNEKSVKYILQESINRVHTISKVHEELYRNKTFAKLDFDLYVKDLLEDLKNAINYQNTNVKFEYELEKSEINISQAIPLGLIINELITNCFKYAFLENKEPCLKLLLKRKPDGKCTVVIHDNGPGLPDDVDITRPEKLGFEIINSLLRQLKGSVSYTRDQGARFVLEFPLE